MVNFDFIIDAIKTIEGGKSLYGKGVMNSLITVQEFENLLNLTPFTNTKRFRPTYPPKEDIKWVSSAWTTDVESAPAHVIEDLMETGVCYMVDCSRVNQNINKVSSIIENLIERPVDCHLYFYKRPELDNYFNIHKDQQHNIICQVDGTTHWKVGSKVYDIDDPVNIPKFFDDDELCIDIELNPGDAIAVPANVYHQPINMTKRISASFAIAPNSVDTYNRTWIKW